MKRKQLYMMFLFIFFGILSTAFTQDSQFYQANQFYRDGQYTEAIASYEKILKEGKASGALYYNLGNSYFKNEQLGKAILNYKRAQRLIPRDSDVAFNLKHALSRVKYGMPVKNQGIIKKIVDKYTSHLTLDELSKVVLMSYFIICSVILGGLFLGWSKKKIAWLTIIFFIGGLFHAGALFSKAGHYEHLAIAIEDIEARFEPVDNATVHFNLPQGNSAVILKQKNGWIKFKRSDGKIGWTKSKVLEAI